MGLPGALSESLYTDLRRIASAHLRRERAGHTLQTTAVVHEAYLKLAGRIDGTLSGKAAFCAAAVQAIRRVLLDHARGRRRAKRGGPAARRVTLSSGDLLDTPREWDYCDIHDALEELEAIDPRVARVVELRFLCGLTDDETAAALGCARRTVLRDWRFARAWLARRLSAYGPAGAPHRSAPPPGPQ